MPELLEFLNIHIAMDDMRRGCPVNIAIALKVTEMLSYAGWWLYL